jgi:DNA-directed RNA polymerase specialized sigma24 family protein
MSEQEMSEELHVAPGTVKWRLHQARQRLSNLLRGEWSEVK